MKKVQFACDVEFVATFANEDYDRTAQEVAKLTYKDMLELLTMKSQWRRDMERMMAERETTEEKVVNVEPNNSASRLFNVQEICI
ncbi:uncharacterized protein EV154DRAFT_450861 [Mucor mucedo]|uniref:Uncharacterized protein n=1 Tax=Mucor saturninus TaxID=64648 RepID=A0A8H7QT49_9FUNG|nr:uncharacterized protein EV154DRAFT_450861 [Mucor mucedo]KAG2197278.1 hypothetical protein INT47_010984 [Mucor saturninus]KAI7879845.1 hypothetical protein EV154DRAFT_450861 [Mucor mucedo]